MRQIMTPHKCNTSSVYHVQHVVLCADEAVTRQDRVCTARRQGSWQKEGKRNHGMPKHCYMGGSCRLERLWEILPRPNNEKARSGDMERGRERGASGGAHAASWRQHQFSAWAEIQSLWGSCGRMWGGKVEIQSLWGSCETAGWKATHFPVEVGCRGFIATSITKWIRVAGLCPKKRSILTKALQETVEKASHWIWVKRDFVCWLVA